jgi:hypothetical protein
MGWPLVRRSAFATALARLTAAKEEAGRVRAERDEALAERDEGRRALENTGLRLADAEAELAGLRATPDPMEGLTAEDVRDLLERFSKGNACPTCVVPGAHVGAHTPQVIESVAIGDTVTGISLVQWESENDCGARDASRNRN